jgi:3-oxoacyl-[acyl-carrier protein] reductase
METIMSKLQGKVAVVTGASKGIGAGIAKALAAEGASVVVNFANDKDGAGRVVQSITSAGGKAVAVKGSVAEDAETIVGAAVENFGKLDILVNNAGVYEFAPVEEVTPEHFFRQFNTNVLGLLLVTKEAAKHLPEGGSVINIGSLATRALPPASSVYTGTKAAVDAITGVLSKELGPRKIRVNSLNPGFVLTEGTQTAGIAGSDFAAQIVAQTPLGRAGQPQDIATAAVFLASEDSAWITGEQINAGGGVR